MKKATKYFVLLPIAAAIISSDSFAQRRRPGTEPTPTPTTEETRQSTNRNEPVVQPVVTNTNIPIVFDTTAGSNGFSGPSLRDYNAFDKSSINDRTPLPYDHIRWDDAMYAEMVWRELDFREKINKVFQYNATEGGESQMFIDILMRAVNSGQVQAFTDDAFTTPLGTEGVAALTVGGFDTTNRYDVNDPTIIAERVVTRKSFDANSVNKMLIREQWIVDREASRMVCRILGIAPVQTVMDEDGNELGQKQLFWVYYPDLRPILVKNEVYNSRNMGAGRMTWEELFESRMFSSYITKSSINNPGNRTIKSMIKDPILALLEGENIKEKIFNFEQDLWEY